MFKKILLAILGLVVGISLGYCAGFYLPGLSFQYSFISPLAKIVAPKKQIIGFLPYWLLDKAKTDYSQELTTLTYFGLTLDTDGSILKMNNPQEAEPGWYALQSGKLDPFFQSAKKNKLDLSLLIFSGDQDTIASVMNDPIPHAQNLIKEVSPIMKQYGFTSLNLDIEATNEASNEARLHFTQFVEEVKQQLEKKKLGSLTVEVSPTDLIKHDLINAQSVSQLTDYMVIMAYDYHFAGSYVTGPVAPLSGAGIMSEYDTEAAIQKALQIMPAEKIVLGIPLYGYEWETIGNTPRSAVLPGSGLSISTKDVEDFLSSCATCSAKLDTDAKESYVIYQDQETGTYHQIFYPDQNATQTKVQFAEKNDLGGVAMWALGYENNSVIAPLASYKNTF